jgi:hypothetical protein
MSLSKHFLLYEARIKIERSNVQSIKNLKIFLKYQIKTPLCPNALFGILDPLCHVLSLCQKIQQWNQNHLVFLSNLTQSKRIS